jgi:hypothetical protein
MYKPPLASSYNPFLSTNRYGALVLRRRIRSGIKTVPVCIGQAGKQEFQNEKEYYEK